jgi:hypothetical protein
MGVLLSIFLIVLHFLNEISDVIFALGAHHERHFTPDFFILIAFIWWLISRFLIKCHVLQLFWLPI